MRAKADNIIKTLVKHRRVELHICGLEVKRIVIEKNSAFGYKVIARDKTTYMTMSDVDALLMSIAFFIETYNA